MRRRRIRQPTACRECRRRKVSCDPARPCQRCQKRGHPEICSTEDALSIARERGLLTGTQTKHVSKNPERSAFSPSALAVHSRSVSSAVPLHLDGSTAARAVALLERISDGLKSTSRTDPSTGETIFLGQYASATFFRSVVADTASEIFSDETSIESCFALSNRTTLHPFTALWQSTRSLDAIFQALPKAPACMGYYYAYRQAAGAFYPLPLNLDEFEGRMCDLLQSIHDIGLDATLGRTSSQPHNQQTAWYGVLFAVLAAGCQCSNTKPSERILTSRVFVACSFECLRLANLYVQTSPEVIQSMLILEAVICNDCNPGCAWALLALTARQAHAMGLHIEGLGTESLDLWEILTDFDCSLSIAFDRTPIDIIATHHSRHDTTSTFSRSAADKLKRLQLNFQMMLSKSSDALSSPARLGEFLILASNIEVDAQNTTLGNTIASRIQHLINKITLAHFKAELHRLFALGRPTPAPTRHEHLSLMMSGYRAVVSDFLMLLQLSPTAKTSWILVHYVMSSALILAAVGLALRDYDKGSSELLHKLMDALEYEPADGETDVDKAAVMAPFEHGLEVLRRLLA